jgi:hypothetical protein
MRVLIGCECSGIVREAFARRGHDAWSCDLKPSEQPGKHIQDNVLNVLNDGWDLGIFHPECKFLCWSGERWIKQQPGRELFRNDAFQFFKKLYNCNIKRKCLENSLSLFLDRNFKKPTQYIHPYHFGEPYKKTTCLWLQNLPPLQPTNILPIGKRYPFAYMVPGNKKQSETRARTFTGIAEAMAEQWGNLS